MKNLKKVLALVLAFACAFTMFAGAAFTDATDIEASTAVDMLNALGVINGYADGSFKPAGTVTRAEMAKMIYVVRNQGNDNADSWKSGVTKFNDVNGHWAAGYIKFCEAQKIIAGKIDTVVVYPVTVKKVTFVGKTSITAGTSYKFDDCTIYDGVKKDDWALIVDAKYTADDTTTISKAEVMSGKVTGKKTGSAKIDGVWYDLKDGVDVTTNSTYDFAIVGGIIFNAEETAEGGQKSVLFLSALDGKKVDGDFDNEDGYVKAKAYFLDGTNKTIKITKFDNKKLVKEAEFGALKPSSLYTYGVNSSDEYELKQFTSNNKAGYDSYKMTGNGWASEKIDGTAIASDAVVFVQNTAKGSGEVKVLSGKTVKDWANTTAYGASQKLMKVSNGINYVQVGVLTSSTATSIPGASGDYKYGYLTSDAFDSSLNGDTAVEMNIWNGSSDETVYVDTSSADSNWVTGAVIEYSEDGKFIKINAVRGSKEADLVAITGFDRTAKGELNAITSAGAATKVTTLHEDCVVIGVDTDKQVGAEGDMSAVPLADEVADGAKLTANALLFTTGTDEDEKIIAIVYDTNNKWRIDGDSFDFTKPAA